MGASTIIKGFTAAIAAAMLIAQPVTAFAEDKFDVFTVYDEANTQFIGYDEFDTFLKHFGVKRGKRLNMHYSAMRPQGVVFLDSYRDALGGVSPSKMSRQEQLAYWLNLRNLLVIRAIAVDSPGRSLKGERGDHADPGEMWTRRRLTIEGVSLSIDDIERHIILRNFDDPNIIYGLYQGVKGGPALWNKGFRGATVHQELEALGKTYVNDGGVIRVRSNEVRVPLVFHWYKQALFNGEDSKVIEHLTAIAKPQLGASLGAITSLGKQKFSYSLDEHQVRQQQQYRPSSGGGVGGGSGS